MQRLTFLTAFTLIELLVVITIIVVLLALLTPALDKAIYQAELAVCGARQKALATSVQVYAFDFQRHYPYRDLMRRSSGWPNQLNNNNIDDRFLLREWLDLNGVMNCPLSADVDLEYYGKDAAGRPTWTFASYDLWFGFRYTGIASMRGMYRVGDRFEWLASTADGDKLYAFDILTCDEDMMTPNGLNTITSHPDRDPAVMFNRVLDNTAYEGASFVTSAGTLYAYSWWDSRSDGAGRQRGVIERQFARQDGSVQRIDDITTHDERFVLTPFQSSDGANSAWFIQLPE